MNNQFAVYSMIRLPEHAGVILEDFMKSLRLQLSLIVWAFSCVACGPSVDISAARATTEAETTLTGMYGAEVRTAIENFETKWFSREDHLDPKVQREIATDEFLRSLEHTYDNTKPFGEPYGLVTKSAVVVSVRVLEYSPDRFKAVAGVIEQVDEVTPEGELKQSLPYHKFCGVYVFLQEENVWKLAAFFDITNSDIVAREWDYAPGTLKLILGDLPSSDCNFSSLP
jgi:hypothetical protein